MRRNNHQVREGMEMTSFRMLAQASKPGSSVVMMQFGSRTE